ncbi:unnamed protein product [Urochloa humidicola]
MEGFVVMFLLVVSMEVLGAASGVLLPPPMYVFGDSYLDVGNNNYLPGADVPRANMAYYGVDFPGFPTGRFSNGFNTADYIAKKIGLAGSPPPYLSLAWSSSLVVSTALTSGMSYASGGAGILNSTNAGNTIPLWKQVQHFNATRSKMVAAVGSGSVNSLLSRCVVLIGAGGNDLAAFANQNTSSASDGVAFYDSIMSNYSAVITDLYTLGARKFAITNVGLAGCLPVARLLDAAGSCSDLRNARAYSFDDRLRNMLADLAGRLPGFLYSLADTFALMVDTFFDPQASSGFTDVASACCGGGRLGAEAECSPNATLCADRDKYYFWDNVHVTQRAAMLRAQAFYDGPAKYTTPVNFKQLVEMTAA